MHHLLHQPLLPLIITITVSYSVFQLQFPTMYLSKIMFTHCSIVIVGDFFCVYTQGGLEQFSEVMQTSRLQLRLTQLSQTLQTALCLDEAM